MAFDPNTLGGDETDILARVAAGEWATFSERTEKPRIAAAFIRHLMLGLPGPDGKPWPIAPTGVRIRNIHVEGLLDLCDASGRDGAPLPALLLESCDFPDPIHLDHAHLARLSLKGARFRELRGVDCQLDGALNISNVGPYSIDGVPDQCWVSMPECQISGDVDIGNSHFVQEMKRAGARNTIIPTIAANFGGASVGGDVIAFYLQTSGGVSFERAKIEGGFFAYCAKLTSQALPALNMSSAQFGGSVHFGTSEFKEDYFESTGSIWLSGAAIGGSLEADNVRIRAGNPEANDMALVLDNSTIGGSVFLRCGFRAEGQVRLLGAKISGNVEADGSNFSNRRADGEGWAIVADNAEIGGHMFLRRGFHSYGQVLLLKTRIGGNFDASGGRFVNSSADGKSVSIFADNSEIGGSAHFRNGFHSEGEVSLRGAKVLGSLEAYGGSFINRTADGTGRALDADNAEFGGGVYISNGFSASGVVRFGSAKIAGNLESIGGTFLNQTGDGNGIALMATGVSVGGSVYLRKKFHAHGQVRFIGAVIDGGFEFPEGDFNNNGSGEVCLALMLDGARIGKNFFAGPLSKIVGTVSAQGLTTSGDVDLSGLTLIDRNEAMLWPALDLTGARVGGGFILRNPRLNAEPANITGTVALTRASIAGEFLASGATLKPFKSGGVSLEASGVEVMGDARLDADAKISGRVEFQGAAFKRGFKVACARKDAVTWNLENASAHTLDDADGNGWGSTDSVVKLDGFRYETFETGVPAEPRGGWRQAICSLLSSRAPLLAQRRLDWFARHVEPLQVYEPHPYLQLARVFRRKGHDEDARHILYRKQWRAWHLAENPWSKPFGALFGFFFAFGYSTWHSIMTVLFFICIGTIGVKHLNATGVLVIDSAPVASVAAQDTPAVPQAIADAARTSLPCGDAINPWLYAIDVFVPLIDLRQESKCEPSSDADGWRWAKAIYALLGWIVTSLAILTFSGVLQRRGEDL